MGEEVVRWDWAWTTVDDDIIERLFVFTLAFGFVFWSFFFLSGCMVLYGLWRIHSLTHGTFLTSSHPL